MYREAHEELIVLAQKLRSAEQLGSAISAYEQDVAQQRARVQELQSRHGASHWGRRSQPGARLDDKKARRALELTREVGLLEAAEDQVAWLRREKEALGDVEGRYREAFEQKVQTLAAQRGVDAERVVAIARELAAARVQREESERAIVAGKAAIRRLDAALRALGAPTFWNSLAWGMRSSLDPVAAHIGRAQHLLHRFRRELMTVVTAPQLGRDLGGLQRLDDLFFEELARSWFSPRRIRLSRKIIEQLRAQVVGSIEHLENELGASDRRIDGLYRDFAQMVHDI